MSINISSVDMAEEIICNHELFTAGEQPMLFVIEHTEKNEPTVLSILHGGGQIVSSKNRHGIYLASPDESVSVEDEDVFSTEFIADCCKANRIIDINGYRSNGPTKYPGVNVMKILRRQCDWPDCTSRVNSGTSSVQGRPALAATTKSQKSPEDNGLSQRANYSATDEKNILEYIVENGRIGLLEGNALWKEIAQQKVCPGHAWQSMKRHFQQKMLPNISKCTFLSIDDRMKFQKQIPYKQCRGKPTRSRLRQQRSHSNYSLNDSPASDQEYSNAHASSENDANDSESEGDRRSPKKRKLYKLAGHDEHSSSSACSNSDSNCVLTLPKRSRTDRMRHHSPPATQSCSGSSDSGHRHRERSGMDGRTRCEENSLIVDRSRSESRHRRSQSNVTDEMGSESKSTSPTLSDDWFVPPRKKGQPPGKVKIVCQPSRSSRRKRREEFTLEEELSILKYLDKHNRFSTTGGNNVWKNMAATEPSGSRHTWQSLRERYLKKIVPNIDRYNVSEEVKARIKSKATGINNRCTKAVYPT